MSSADKRDLGEDNIFHGELKLISRKSQKKHKTGVNVHFYKMLTSFIFYEYNIKEQLKPFLKNLSVCS